MFLPHSVGPINCFKVSSLLYLLVSLNALKNQRQFKLNSFVLVFSPCQKRFLCLSCDLQNTSHRKNVHLMAHIRLGAHPGQFENPKTHKECRRQEAFQHMGHAYGMTTPLNIRLTPFLVQFWQDPKIHPFVPFWNYPSNVLPHYYLGLVFLCSFPLFWTDFTLWTYLLISPAWHVLYCYVQGCRSVRKQESSGEIELHLFCKRNTGKMRLHTTTTEER